jgi:hypothetical protein
MRYQISSILASEDFGCASDIKDITCIEVGKYQSRSRSGSEISQRLIEAVTGIFGIYQSQTVRIVREYSDKAWRPTPVIGIHI